MVIVCSKTRKRTHHFVSNRVVAENRCPEPFDFWGEAIVETQMLKRLVFHLVHLFSPSFSSPVSGHALVVLCVSMLLRQGWAKSR